MESEYYFKSRSLPLIDTYDVIVLGGGPAGCAAAASSAREGASTLQIERTGALGGMGTGALVPAWCPFTDGEQIIYKGIAEEVFLRLKSMMPFVPQDKVSWVPIDAEKLKIVYDDLVLASGAQILFETLASSAEGGSGQIEALVCAGKGGLRAYSAKVFIDCTGDADIAAFGGAAFHLGDENGEGELMPATHCFVIAGVDEAAFARGSGVYQEDPGSPIYPILESGEFPLITDSHICNNFVAPGAVGFNAGHIWNVDNSRPESISEALVLGRKMAQQYRDALAKYFPSAFSHSYVAQTGSLMGVRESRRIVGEYCLSVEDYKARRSFSDEIARNCYFLDIHPPQSKKTLEAKDLDEWRERILRYNPGESHGVPFRCLLPVGLENVIVAGRAISCKRAVQGSIRVMPCCLVTGQAAGTAAAMAVKSGVSPKKVDVSALRNRLRACGAYLP